MQITITDPHEIVTYFEAKLLTLHARYKQLKQEITPECPIKVNHQFHVETHTVDEALYLENSQIIEYLQNGYKFEWEPGSTTSDVVLVQKFTENQKDHDARVERETKSRVDWLENWNLQNAETIQNVTIELKSISDQIRQINESPEFQLAKQICECRELERIKNIIKTASGKPQRRGF